jgi:hypothetical protein
MTRKPVPRKRYVLIGISAGEDHVEANRLMRVIAETLGKTLPTKTPTYMTTVDVLPHVLAKPSKP